MDIPNDPIEPMVQSQCFHYDPIISENSWLGTVQLILSSYY